MPNTHPAVSYTHLLLELLAQHYPQVLAERYKLSQAEGKPGYELLEQLGRARGFLLPGAQIDTERAARILLDEFRSGKLGAFTLEFPPEDTP